MSVPRRMMIVLGLVLAGQAGLADGLSPELRQRILSDPADFLDAAATATHWFGDPRGLNAAAIADFVAAERARRRADAMALLLGADLNDDGAVSRAEVGRLAPSLTRAGAAG